jgi:hypothetical protein
MQEENVGRGKTPWDRKRASIRIRLQNRRSAMQSLPPLASEINRMIRYLAGAGAGLSLLSISTSSLPYAVIQGLIEVAAIPTDMLGHLVDGSVGVLTIRPHGDDGELDLEQGFLERLRPAMREISERRFGGRVTLWLRAVHRPAAEIGHAADLINCLFDVVSVPYTINSNNAGSTISRISIFPRPSPIMMPFIEPIEKEPALLRAIRQAPYPPYFD